MLPGFVMGKDRVVWVGERDSDEEDGYECEIEVEGRSFEMFEREVVMARREWHQVLERELDSVSKGANSGRGLSSRLA